MKIREAKIDDLKQIAIIQKQRRKNKVALEFYKSLQLKMQRNIMEKEIGEV